MYALIDGNAFYASCEQVFDPALRGKPLVVLSNNDGCAIARTDQAKALGIKMGHPAHELRHLVRSHGLIMRSANFALYGDMQRRVVAILRDAVCRVEVYSIDESFLDLSGIRDRPRFARELRDRVHRWTGIPNCIGIGPSLTLAKLANKAAKKGAGVVDVSDAGVRAEHMAVFPIDDVWGVGPQWAAQLRAIGVETAGQFCAAPSDLILSRFGVTLQRTQRELQGHPCRDVQEVEPDRQQIVVSRSFGSRVESHAAVVEALCTFASMAAAKLRGRNLVAAAVTAVIETDAFRPDLPQHNTSRTVSLASSTADTMEIVRIVRRLGAAMLRKGFSYKRAGVVLMDLARPDRLQADLFDDTTSGNAKLMNVMDSINGRFGRAAIGLGATGWREKPEWGMRQQSLSRRFTSRPAELPIARC